LQETLLSGVYGFVFMNISNKQKNVSRLPYIMLIYIKISGSFLHFLDKLFTISPEKVKDMLPKEMRDRNVILSKRYII
jgi:hypothetical protein